MMLPEIDRMIIAMCSILLKLFCCNLLLWVGLIILAWEFEISTLFINILLVLLGKSYVGVPVDFGKRDGSIQNGRSMTKRLRRRARSHAVSVQSRLV